MSLPQPRPSALTVPQRHALQALRDGWQCQTCGSDPVRFHTFVWLSFRRDGRVLSVAGSTLASFQRRNWITWEETRVTLAYDGSQVPGWTLVLTPAGQDVATHMGDE